jgi:hypothetical protein
MIILEGSKLKKVIVLPVALLCLYKRGKIHDSFATRGKAYVFLTLLVYCEQLALFSRLFFPCLAINWKIDQTFGCPRKFVLKNIQLIACILAQRSPKFTCVPNLHVIPTSWLQLDLYSQKFPTHSLKDNTNMEKEKWLVEHNWNSIYIVLLYICG